MAVYIRNNINYYWAKTVKTKLKKNNMLIPC